MHQAGLDLVAYLDDALGYHCPLCFFLELDNGECPHKQQTDGKPLPPAPFSFVSEHLSYAHSSTNEGVESVTDSTHTTVTAKLSDVSSNDTERSLKRKSSPTATTLRELRVEHSQQMSLSREPSRQRLLRTQQSDDRLRQLYETQLMSYLESPISDFNPFSS